MRRILLLENPGENALTQRHRPYPLPDGVEPKPFYLIDGECWTLKAILTSEDVVVNTLPTVPR